MSGRYYVDACIWRDFHENREDKFRPLGEWAFNFFRMVRETKSIVLYSDLIVEELSIAYDVNTIKEILKIAEGSIEKVQVKKEQFQEAARIKRERKLPFADLLHAIIARDNSAIMVTRDIHFEDFEDIVATRKPEDLF